MLNWLLIRLLCSYRLLIIVVRLWVVRWVCGWGSRWLNWWYRLENRCWLLVCCNWVSFG